jgi:GH15 family glucan-1,4-alpha-glucosidase
MAPTYPVNDDDDAKNLPGVLIGRFPGDNFQGNKEDDGNGTVHDIGDQWGNPWFLATHVLADFLYQVALGAIQGLVEVNRYSRPFLDMSIGWACSKDKRATLPKVCTQTKGGKDSTLDSSTGSPYACARALIFAGDGVLQRSKSHAKAGLHMNEQIERGRGDAPFKMGDSVSAADLSWSYASVLDALKTRWEAVKALQAKDEGLLVSANAWKKYCE